MKMKTTNISFDVSLGILNALNQNGEEFTQQTRLITALHLFQSHKLTFGQASELAGRTREVFLIELDKNGIDLIDYEDTELEKELQRLRA